LSVPCPYCSAKVDATVIATHESHTDDETVDLELGDLPNRATLLLCPVCKSFILGIEEAHPSGETEWWDMDIVWPPSKSLILADAIPSGIRASLREAYLVLQAGAPIASAAMSGRAIEGICRHYETQSPNLRLGLQELKERGVIDGRLYQWSQELHWHRNVACRAGYYPARGRTGPLRFRAGNLPPRLCAHGEIRPVHAATRSCSGSCQSRNLGYVSEGWYTR
jgi:hypothetical protein